MASILSVLITGSSAGLNAALSGAAARIAAFQRQVGGGSAALGGLATAGVLAGAAVAAAFVAGVSKSAEFEQAMSRAEAATMETGASLNALREAALDAGASTAFSAVEAADAITELGKAGISSADILGGALDGALALAAAGELDVATAAELAATAMTQFGLAGSDVPHIADLLAAGAGKAQGSVEDLGAALNQSALVANNAGLSIEDTTGALAQFAAAGLIGSDAGTAFKSMLQRLTPVSAESAALMDELGLSAYDAQGNFVGLDVYAQDLQDTLGGMTQEQRNATLATLFGSDAVRAATVLYQGGSAGVQQWAEAVDDAGFAAEQAAIKQDNLRGDLEKLGGAFDTLLIKLGTGAQEPLRALTQGLTGVVDGLSQLGEQDQLGPFFSDVSAIVEHLWVIVGYLWDAVDGAVIGLTQLGAGAIVAGLSALAAVLSAITGFLADNEELAIAVGIALTAAFVQARLAAAGYAGWAGIATLATLGLFSGAATLTAGFAAATAAVGRLLAVSAPLAALTLAAGFVIGLTNIGEASEQAAEDVDAFWKAFADADTAADKMNVASTAAADFEQKVADLNAEVADRSSVDGLTEGVGDFFSALAGGPTKIADLEKAIALAGAGAKSAQQELILLTSGVAEVAREFGVSEQAAIDLAAAYGISLVGGLSEFEAAQLRFLSTTPDTTAVQEDAAVAASELAEGFGDTAEAADNLLTIMEALTGQFKTFAGSQADYGDSQRSLTDAINAQAEALRNGGESALTAAGGLDLLSEAGGDLYVEFEGLAESGQAVVDALVRQGDTEGALAQSTALREKFLADAAAAGIEESAAIALADGLLGVPTEVETAIISTGGPEAVAAGQAVEDQLRDIPVSTEPRVTLFGSPESVQRAVNVDQALGGIPIQTLPRVAVEGSPTAVSRAQEVDRALGGIPITTLPYIETRGSEAAAQEARNVQAEINSIPSYRRSDISVVTTYSTVGTPGTRGVAATGGYIDRGNVIPGYAAGVIIGPGTGTSDSILARTDSGAALRVSNGEFIVNAARTAEVGVGNMMAFNAGLLDLRGYADGGRVGETFGRSLAASGAQVIDYERLARAVANQPAPYFQVVGTFEGGPLFKLVDQRIRQTDETKALHGNRARRVSR